MDIIKQGSLLTISTGEYSDYFIQGVFRATKEINVDELTKTYLAENPRQRKEFEFNDSQFLGWVARQGFLEPIDCYEWHLSEYGKVERMMLYERDKYNEC
jgi:hypothetical protein